MWHDIRHPLDNNGMKEMELSDDTIPNFRNKLLINVCAYLLNHIYYPFKVKGNSLYKIAHSDTQIERFMSGHKCAREK